VIERTVDLKLAKLCNKCFKDPASFEGNRIIIDYILRKINHIIKQYCGY